MATTWVILGGQMTATSLFGYPINTETMQNINPIFVMSLIPILSFSFIRRSTARAFSKRRRFAA